jgi:hypothetical protein
MTKQCINAKSTARAAVAAALTGVLLVGSVPTAALAEALNESQATATQQTEQSEDDTGAETTDVNADNAANETDAEATDATTTEDSSAQATSDQQSAEEDNAATNDEDTSQTEAETSDSATNQTEASDAAVKSAQRELKGKVEVWTPDDDSPSTSDQSTSGQSTSNQGSKWQTSGGEPDSSYALKCGKALCEAIGNFIGGKYGSGVVSLLGMADTESGVEYTNNDLMHELFNIENQIGGISTQVYNLQNSLGCFERELNLRNDLERISGFKNLLCDKGGVADAIQSMNNALAGYKELDDQGNETDVTCSLATPVDHLPQGARDYIMTTVANLDGMADQYTYKSSVAGVEYVLYDSICSNSNNLVKDYFNYLTTKCNWDVETFDSKATYVSLLAQMYANAYMIENASLQVQIANAKKAGTGTSALESKLASLASRATAVNNALFGEDGESGFSAETRSNGSTVTNYVTNETYDTGTYACVAAYSSKCFEAAIADGRKNSTDLVASSWQVSSTFTADQVTEMVKRLNTMRAAGIAPTKDDGSQVDGILEEMASLGFKNVDTDSEDTDGDKDHDTTWVSRVKRHHGWDNTICGVIIDDVDNTYAELGDPNQTSRIPETGDYRLGERLTNSSDYVITNVTKPRIFGGSSVNANFGNWPFKTYCAYGDVVNVKTGEQIHDQLLYVVRNETNGSFSHSYLSYYAFGVLSLGTTDPNIK